MIETQSQTLSTAANVPEGVPEKNMRLTGQKVGGWFVAKYIAAMIGIYVALVTPASVTLSAGMLISSPCTSLRSR